MTRRLKWRAYKQGYLFPSVLHDVLSSEKNSMWKIGHFAVCVLNILALTESKAGNSFF